MDSTVNHHPEQKLRGIAVKDLEPKSTVLLVAIPELMPNVAFGSIASGIRDENVSLKGRDGNPITTTVTSANHVVATWDGASNQRYPPLVREGEPVTVWRVEGQDKYRWSSTGSGRDFRKQDRVHFEVAAMDPKNPDAEKNDSNTYSMYMDATTKKVGFKTSKANGEAVAMSMEADLANGTLHFSDDNADLPNRIYMDTGSVSGTPVFQVNLSTGIVLKLEGEDLYLKVPGKLFADIGDRVLLNSPLTIVNKDKKGIVIINAAQVVVNTAKDFIVSAGRAIGLNGAGTKIAGVLVAGAARIANAVKGPAGSNYNETRISDPVKSMPSEADNSPDTSIAGSPYRST